MKVEVYNRIVGYLDALTNIISFMECFTHIPTNLLNTIT